MSSILIMVPFNGYGSEDRDKLFALIEEKYREVLRINREDTEALREWGLALNDQAEQKEEEEADLLFAKVENTDSSSVTITVGVRQVPSGASN